jgi:regulator of protease activity HflC (stomatin/prohibitin superfamily)
MAIAIILGILFVVLAIVAGILAYFAFDNANKAGGIVAVVSCIVLSLAFLCVPFSIRTVDASEVAVVKSMGKIEGTREAGTHFDFWMFNTYEKYDIKVRQIDITTAAYTAGDMVEEKSAEDNTQQTTKTKAQLQPIDLQLTVHYQVNKESVEAIAVEYGTLTALEGRISSVVTAKVKEVVKKYEAAQLISERDVLASEVLEAVNTALGSDYHVTVKNVALTNIDFSDAFEQSVEQSMIAQQELVKAEAEAEKLLIDAKNKVEIALQEAEAKKAAAAGEAEAIKIAAQAEADALALIEAAWKAIDDDVREIMLREMAIENWDGKLPETMVGSDFIEQLLGALGTTNP